MATETKPPDAVLESTAYSALNLADIDEDPGSPDAAFGTWAGIGNTIARVSFPTPSGTPNTGAGMQTFRAYVKRTVSAAPNPTAGLYLWENGSSKALLWSGSITSTTGQLIIGTWDATLLGTPNGSGVELRLVQLSGGTSINRSGVVLGAAAWDVDYAAPTRTASGSETTGGASASGAATHTAPTATGSGSATIGGADAAGSASHTAPTRTATCDATVAATGASAAGACVAPEFTATCSATSGSVFTNASGSASAPVSTGAVDAQSGSTQVAVSGTTSAPVFTASGSAATAGAESDAGASNTPPSFIASGSLPVCSIGVDGAVAVAQPVVSGSGSCVVCGASMGGAAIVVNPTFAGSVGLIVGATDATAEGAFHAPRFSAAAELITGMTRASARQTAITETIGTTHSTLTLAAHAVPAELASVRSAQQTVSMTPISESLEAS